MSRARLLFFLAGTAAFVTALACGPGGGGALEPITVSAPANAPVPASVGVPTLLSPTPGDVVPQNVPLNWCPFDRRRGNGLYKVFDWTDSNASAGVLHYEIIVQRASAPIPLVNATTAESRYVLARCNAFVTDTNLDGWQWRVRAVDRLGNASTWTPTWTFSFGRCRIGTRPCST